MYHLEIELRSLLCKANEPTGFLRYYISVTTMTNPLSSALGQGESKKGGEAEGNKFQASIVFSSSLTYW